MQVKRSGRQIDDFELGRHGSHQQTKPKAVTDAQAFSHFDGESSAADLYYVLPVRHIAGSSTKVPFSFSYAVPSRPFVSS
jgi:tricorn protease-like protein